MSDKLEVEIGASIKDLESKLASAQKKLGNFANASDKNLSKFGKASANATKDVTKLGKGAISGSSAMTSFNRTIQDAPFGLMGVSNNITNLTEQFGYLKAKTGSSGSALKAMLKDLKGFGGISFGISLATSLLLVFGDKIFKTEDKVKSLRKAQEDLTKSLDDYAFGLDAVSKARLKGTQSAQKELLTLKVLKSVAEDTTKSTVKRAGAVDTLRKLYPEYLDNLTDEQVKSGSLTTVYDKLTTSIMKRAKATASMNVIVKNSEQLLNLESQLASKRDEIAKKEIQNEKDRAKIQKGGSYRTGTKDFEKQVERSADLIEKLKKQANDLQGTMQSIELENIELEQNVDLTSIVTVGGSSGKGEGEMKEKVYSMFDTLKNITTEGIQDFADFSIANPLDLSSIIPVETVNTAFNENMNLVMENAKAKAEEFTKGIKNVLGGSLANTFSSLGDSLGNGLMSVNQVITQGLGDLLSNMGDYLIQAGTASVLAGTVTKLFGSISGVGAGLAAIAGGVLLKGIGSGISSFGGAGAESTTSNASSSSGTSSFSGGSSGGFSSGSGGGTVVFEIAGNKLVGVLSTTLRQNRSLGGSLSLI